MTGEMVIRLVCESNEEIILKKFLKKIEKICGEDYAVETLSSNIDLAKSINTYSKIFDNFNNTTIMYILLKSFVLSLDKSDYIDQTVNEYILKENIKELKELISNNLMFRKYLIRKLINQSDKKNIDLYKKQNDKSLIYEELDILYTYERVSKVKKFDYSNSKRRRR